MAGKDITNQRFGRLTAVKPLRSEKKIGVIWLCRCDCGGEKEVPTSRLIHGTTRSCGCMKEEKRHRKDITGQKFRMLTALYATEKRDRNNSVIWHCRCDCGNEVDIAFEDLKFSKIVSCGCYKKRRTKQTGETYLTRIAGTSVNYLEKAKIRKDNKTGVKGVFFFRGKYIAEINFQKKCYRLGKFNTLAEAVEARKQAEQLLHGNFLVFYERWKTRANADPEWGKENPVSVQVHKTDIGELQVIVYPNI